MRSRRLLAAATGVTIAALGLSVPAHAAAPQRGAPVPQRIGTTDLVHGWRIQSSKAAGGSGPTISRPDYSTAGWLPISRPETLMAGLLENGRYPHVFHSDNLRSVPTAQFDVDWWYRDQLRIHPRPGRHTFLTMNGVAAAAGMWINGHRLDRPGHLQGSYAQYRYDVTEYLHDGENAIALEVTPNDASKYLTVNQVDWNPAAPDHNTGLQFPPQLTTTGPVSVRNAHVIEHNAADLKSSDLTVRATLHNNTGASRQATYSGAVTRGRTRIPFARRVTLPAHGTRTVTLTPADVPGLHLRHPAIWWPYQLGGQPMYHLAVHATVAGAPSGRAGDDFGIRTVTSHLTTPVPGKTHGPHGYRRFVTNGVPLVIRGGGWSPDMFLRYSPRDIADQIATIKNMGLNALRFEGNLPPDDMFDQLDRAGVLAMPGWQCCNHGEAPSSEWGAAQQAYAADQAAHVARMLRNHPSVFAFDQGSDVEPDPVKEAIYLKAFRAADWQVPQLSSAEYRSSAQLGPSGQKEGPYNYVPPVYWWSDGVHGTADESDTLTNAGGAWGLDTETSAGNTIPTQDSLNRFLTPADQRKIWDPATTHGAGSGADIFHVYPYNTYTKIGRMGQWNTPLWHRYGSWTDMASYQREAQAAEYENTRAQFEAYLGHSGRKANPSTGVIYWMMNKAWPSLQWNLYGDDFDTPGAYYGAQEASRPLHVMYDYATGDVRVVNLTRQHQAGLQVTASILGVHGGTHAGATAGVPPLDSQQVRTVMHPRVPSGISTTYFLRLRLSRHGHTVDSNVYWLSTKHDRIDWAKTIGEGYGATFQPDGYADLAGLHDLAAAHVTARARTHRSGAEAVTTVTLHNAGNRPVPAFFVRTDLRRGDAAGHPRPGDNEVLPVLWSGDDETLWPGQTVTLTARYRATELRGAVPVVSVSGWNVTARIVSSSG